MPKRKAPEEKMVLVAVHLPPQMLHDIDVLVKRGLFPSRSELIRHAILLLLSQQQQGRQG